MRYLAAGLTLVLLFAGTEPSAALAATAPAVAVDPAVQDGPQATERSVSLVIRVKPHQIKKAASELAEMVQGGESLGLPWLKQAFSAISAEIVVEDAAASGSASTAFRASSAGWIGRDGAPVPDADRRGAKAPGGQESAGGAGAAPSIDARYAAAAAIIGRQAAAIRDGASAIMDSLPADKAAELRQQLEELTTAAGSIGKALEGMLPDRSASGGNRTGPKR